MSGTYFPSETKDCPSCYDETVLASSIDTVGGGEEFDLDEDDEFEFSEQKGCKDDQEEDHYDDEDDEDEDNDSNDVEYELSRGANCRTGRGDRSRGRRRRRDWHGIRPIQEERNVRDSRQRSTMFPAVEGFARSLTLRGEAGCGGGRTGMSHDRSDRD